MSDLSNDNIPAAEWRLAEAEARRALATQRRNERFAAASPARKRTILAKDVLEWLKIGKLRPAGFSTSEGGGGSYYLLVKATSPCEDGYIPSIPDSQLRQVGKVNGYACAACALGGLFAVAVERGACSIAEGDGTLRFHADNAAQSLRDALATAACFDKDQTDLIEYAYEAGQGVAAHIPAFDRKELVVAKAFGLKYDDRASRLTAIMENIIANKGTFIP